MEPTHRERKPSLAELELERRHAWNQLQDVLMARKRILDLQSYGIPFDPVFLRELDHRIQELAKQWYELDQQVKERYGKKEEG